MQRATCYATRMFGAEVSLAYASIDSILTSLSSDAMFLCGTFLLTPTQIFIVPQSPER